MRYYTAKEVANKLKVSTGHVYELVKRGELKKKEGMGRTVRIPSTELGKVTTERSYFTYNNKKVEVISTHLGQVRKVIGKDEYVLTDVVRAVGLKDSYSVTRRIEEKLFHKIEIAEARELGLFVNQFGLILITYKGISEYCKKSRSNLDLDMFLSELEEVEEQLTIDEMPREDTHIKIFDNPEFGQVRTVEIDGEGWLVGKDVALALGYKDTSDSIKRHVDNDDKLTRCFTDSGQSRDMTVINESGLYSLVLSSKLPGAKKFKKWITSEVIPTIRKTGGYVDNSSKFVDNYFSNLSKNTKEIILSELENKNKCLMAQKVKIDKELLDNADVIEKIQETL